MSTAKAFQTCNTEAEARAIVRRLWARGWDVFRVGVVVYLDTAHRRGV